MGVVENWDVLSDSEQARRTKARRRYVKLHLAKKIQKKVIGRAGKKFRTSAELSVPVYLSLTTAG